MCIYMNIYECHIYIYISMSNASKKCQKYRIMWLESAFLTGTSYNFEIYNVCRGCVAHLKAENLY